MRAPRLSGRAIADYRVPAKDIVMVLGMRDDVTPYARGAAMAERWGVPADNLFRRDQGHFSVPVGLMSDPEPLTRLVARLRK